MRLCLRTSSSVTRQNQGIKQSRNREQCSSRRRVAEGARKLRRIGSVKQIAAELNYISF